jgi:hypothetical protein
VIHASLLPFPPLRLDPILPLLAMESDEKKALEKVSHVDQERSTSSITQDNYDEALDEPRQEESLHRSLKARQISMIAVSVFLSAPSSYSQLY